MAESYEQQRADMVERQLRRHGVTHPRVLDVMGRIAREKFVAPETVHLAYENGAMALAEGQTISQPYMVGLMTQELDPQPEDAVLEIGTGSGYQTAILAELARGVYTIERIANLAERAQRIHRDLGYTNIHYRVGDGTLGWPEPLQFERIMVTAGAPHRPERLLAQLAPGGRLVAPVGPSHGQDLMVYTRRPEGAIVERFVCKCVFVPLIGKEGW